MKKILIIFITFALALEAFAADKRPPLKNRLANIVIKKTPILEGKSVSKVIRFIGNEIRNAGELEVNIYFDAYTGDNIGDPLSVPAHWRNPDKSIYDPSKVKIRGAPIAFKNITVIQLLEIVSKTAERPTRYYIEKSEVVLLERDYAGEYFMKNFINNNK